MMLSICFITRDAEKNLGRALRSVADLGAEIIVGDTGSKDGTVTIAESLGARVLAIHWQDDFAAVQNQVLDQATGAWILWLNPDDEVLPKAKEQLPALLSRPDVLAYAVHVQEVMQPERPERYTETWQPRLYRRSPEMRYIGRLHPHFAVPIEEIARREAKQLQRCQLAIRHHAYTSVLTPDKLRWAVRLLELELKDRPGQLHYLIEYGRNLLRLDDARGHEVLAEAADRVLAVAQAPLPPTVTVASLLEYLLNVTPEQSRSRLSAQQAQELALRWFPNSPPLLWLLSHRAFQTSNYNTAAGLLETLVQMGRTGAYDHAAAFDPSLIGEGAVLNLGNCYLRLGQLDKAQACFERLLNDPVHQTQARQGCALVQQRRRQSG